MRGSCIDYYYYFLYFITVDAPSDVSEFNDRIEVCLAECAYNTIIYIYTIMYSCVHNIKSYWYKEQKKKKGLDIDQKKMSAAFFEYSYIIGNK